MSVNFLSNCVVLSYFAWQHSHLQFCYKINLCMVADDYTCYAGITVTRITTSGSTPATDLISANQIDDFSFLTEPFTLDLFDVVLRCLTGLGPSGTNNAALGGWYFGGALIAFAQPCGSVFQVRSGNPNNFPGLINLYPCGSLSVDEEGVYSCMMMNSSMMLQITRVGLYLSGRSKSVMCIPSPYC